MLHPRAVRRGGLALGYYRRLSPGGKSFICRRYSTLRVGLLRMTPELSLGISGDITPGDDCEGGVCNGSSVVAGMVLWMEGRIC